MSEKKTLKEKITKLTARFFDTKRLSIRLVLFNIITSAGIVGGTVSFFVSILLKIDIVQLIGIFLALIVLYVSFYLANWKGKMKPAAIAIVGIITLVLFPLMFFSGGGAYSGMGFWFAIGVLFNFLLIEGLSFYIMLLVQFLAIGLCYLVQYFHPEWIVQLDGEAAILVDIFQSLVVLSISIGLIIRFQNSVYKKAMDEISLQNQRLNETMSELETSRQEAMEANKAKSDFLAQMSHEIRTPINAVLGMNEMILRESTEENILGYAGNAYSAGNALLSIINDILDISKIEAGRLEIVEAEYDLYSLVSDCYHMTADRAGKKGLQFTVAVDETIPSRLEGDMFHLRQIIVNLITNAIKYTDEGSVKIAFSEEREGDTFALKVSVKDTGIGLTEESKAKLFGSFQRFDLKRNQSVEGTGLGLSICKQLSELMGGAIEVESEYGKGSVFCVTVPQKVVSDTPVGKVALNRSTEHHDINETKKFTAPSANILVVDDVEMNLIVFTSLLKQHQMRIDRATSGSQCLSMVEKNQYDVIFLDHMMPEMDGMETFEQMKIREHLNRGTPVVMLTANAISGEKDKYMAAGFSAYLTKPIHSEKLEEMLLRFLPEEKIVWAEKPLEEEPGKDSGEARIDGGDSELLDCKAGLVYAGDSEEAYREILVNYVDRGPEKIEKLKRLYAEEDWKNYVIEVHALKSTSLTVGAKQLSMAAAELERAGKTEDYETIRQKNGELLELYGQVLEAGAEVLGRRTGQSEPEKPVDTEEITVEKLADYRERFRAAAEAFDNMELSALCDEIFAYTFSGVALAEEFLKVKKLADDFECEQALDQAEKIFEKLCFQ